MFKNKIVPVEIIIVSEWKIIGFMGPKFVIFGGNLFDLIMNKLIMHTKLHMKANNCLK